MGWSEESRGGIVIGNKIAKHRNKIQLEIIFPFYEMPSRVFVYLFKIKYQSIISETNEKFWNWKIFSFSLNDEQKKSKKKKSRFSDTKFTIRIQHKI